MKIKKIKVPIFNNRLILVDSTDWSILTKHGIQAQYIPSRSEYIAVAMESKDSIFLVFDTTKKDFDISVVVHEAVHASNYILEDIGHVSSAQNDEVNAYLTQWVSKKCFDFLGLNNKK